MERNAPAIQTFQLDRWFSSVGDEYDVSLGSSDCDTLSVGELLGEAGAESFLGQALAYGGYEGDVSLRAAIAARYSEVSRQDVHVFNGVSEAVYVFMRALVRPGDELIVQAPLFQPLYEIARAGGARLRLWEPVDRGSFSYDVDALERLCRQSPTPSAIVLNFPHNPTGQLLSGAELRRVVELAASMGAIVFSDEAFRLLELPPNETLPAVCDLYERGVSVAGLSKPYGLGGLRIGWLATRAEPVRRALLEYRYYTTLCSNTPCQWLAERALSATDRIVPQNRERIARNLSRLQEFVAEHESVLELLDPKAGTMALVRQRTGSGSEALCRRLVAEKRLLLVPGSCVGLDDGCLRFGLGRSSFDEGIRRLGELLADLP